MKRKSRLATIVGATALAAFALNMQAPVVDAADHADGDAAGGDPPADIADFYAWHTDNDTVVFIMTFNGLMEGGSDPVYDGGVLYTFNVNDAATVDETLNNWDDNQDPQDATQQIHVRFGQNGLEEWGVQVIGASDDPIVGAVDTNIEDQGVRVFAGQREDPFFFDFEGFNNTAANLVDDAEALDIAFDGVIAFLELDKEITGPADFFAGLNVMAIVVEVPDEAFGGDDGFFQTWATTGRVPKR